MIFDRSVDSHFSFKNTIFTCRERNIRVTCGGHHKKTFTAQAVLLFQEIPVINALLRKITLNLEFKVERI